MVPFMGQYRKYGTAREGTADNIRRICTACWINNAADRLIIFSIVCEIRPKVNPVLALNDRWTFGFRESKCFFKGHEILKEMHYTAFWQCSH
jgi:hypothetical protein